MSKKYFLWELFMNIDDMIINTQLLKDIEDIENNNYLHSLNYTLEEYLIQEYYLYKYECINKKRHKM